MTDLKLYESEYRFMDLIWEAEPVRSTELAKMARERLEWKKSTCYTVLKKLEAKGFVQRQRDEQDRRKVLLVLTEAGRAHAKPSPGAQTQEQLFAALTEEEQQTLRKLLEKLEQSWSHPG